VKTGSGTARQRKRSLRARGERLVTEPSRCLECGFAFRKRTRLTRPSHCAVCRSARLTLPVFQLGGG
jgi:predicted Zn-ribbon and HTH transcriptional regulator